MWDLREKSSAPFGSVSIQTSSSVKAEPPLSWQEEEESQTPHLSGSGQLVYSHLWPLIQTTPLGLEGGTVCRRIVWTRAPWGLITRARLRSTSLRKVCHPAAFTHRFQCLMRAWFEPITCVGETSADYSKGFGGKFGVETDKVDKSALGFEYQGKTERHESQKGQ